MSDIQIPSRKFLILMGYMQNIGFDPLELCSNADLSFEQLSDNPPEKLLPGYFYALLYKLDFGLILGEAVSSSARRIIRKFIFLKTLGYYSLIAS